LFKEFEHNQEGFDFHIFRQAVFFSLTSTFFMWFIKLLEWSSNMDFGPYGIYPRTLTGSVGIIVSPFIHADFIHLLSNTLPYISFTLLLFYFYKNVAWEVFIWIYLTTGIWVWAFAREAYHIGASGVIYGLASFLLLSGLLSKNIQLIAISLIVLFLYGGMFYGISPEFVAQNVSWESHLLGAVSGVLIALFFRNRLKAQTSPEIENVEDASLSSTSAEKMTFIYHYKESKKAENKNN